MEKRVKRVKIEVVPDFYFIDVEVEKLPDPKFIIREICNCSDDIKHINGGNYHSEIRIYEVPNTGYFIFVYGNTRETFCDDEYSKMIVTINGTAKYWFWLRYDESFAIYNKRKAKAIIKSYENDDYYIDYYD